ncbi:MAG: hypothetical protein AABW54_01630 [Candidatus Micrarchaeota archaeon]
MLHASPEVTAALARHPRAKQLLERHFGDDAGARASKALHSPENVPKVVEAARSVFDAIATLSPEERKRLGANRENIQAHRRTRKALEKLDSLNAAVARHELVARFAEGKAIEQDVIRAWEPVGRVSAVTRSGKGATLTYRTGSEDIIHNLPDPAKDAKKLLEETRLPYDRLVAFLVRGLDPRFKQSPDATRQAVTRVIRSGVPAQTTPDARMMRTRLNTEAREANPEFARLARIANGMIEPTENGVRTMLKMDHSDFVALSGVFRLAEGHCYNVFQKLRAFNPKRTTVRQFGAYFTNCGATTRDYLKRLQPVLRRVVPASHPYLELVQVALENIAVAQAKKALREKNKAAG